MHERTLIQMSVSMSACATHCFLFLSVQDLRAVAAQYQHVILTALRLRCHCFSLLIVACVLVC